MKPVLLSAGGPYRVYSVPDKIADNLEGACWYFRAIWIFEEPQVQRFLKGDVACYNEKDFIDYLNSWETPETPSVLIEKLTGWEIPEQYKDCPEYNF